MKEFELTPEFLLSLLVGGAALFMQVFGGGRSAGDAGGRIKSLEERVPHLASKSSVDEVTRRVDRLQTQVDDVEQTANATAVNVAGMASDIKGLDRAMRHGFRNLEAGMQAIASFMGRKLPQLPPGPED